MDVVKTSSNLLFGIFGPIGGSIILFALCYCCYRCCRSNKKVVVVNTTNTVQPMSQSLPMVIVNNGPSQRTELDNPVNNLPPAYAPLLSDKMPATGSDIQLNKF